MSKQDSSSISPLHRQQVKRRTIVVAEDPKLHLVWFHDRIFIKPLPQYIVSYAFWEDHLCQTAGNGEQKARVRRAALGYLRTYRHLVRYESDFRIAQDPSLRLVPAGITWEQFCDFTSGLENVQDRNVSERYAYGEIRLSRLNLYAPILLGKSHFQRVEYQYAAYFANYVAPVLFCIGIASVVLSGLQLVASVRKDGEGSWSGVVLCIAVSAVVTACGVIFVMGLVWAYKVVGEWRVAIRDRLRLLGQKRAADGGRV